MSKHLIVSHKPTIETQDVVEFIIRSSYMNIAAKQTDNCLICGGQAHHDDEPYCVGLSRAIEWAFTGIGAQQFFERAGEECINKFFDDDYGDFAVLIKHEELSTAYGSETDRKQFLRGFADGIDQMLSRYLMAVHGVPHA